MPHIWSPRNLKPSKPEEAADEIWKGIAASLSQLVDEPANACCSGAAPPDFHRYLRDNRHRVVHVVPAESAEAAADAGQK